MCKFCTSITCNALADRLGKGPPIANPHTDDPVNGIASAIELLATHFRARGAAVLLEPDAPELDRITEGMTTYFQAVDTTKIAEAMLVIANIAGDLDTLGEHLALVMTNRVRQGDTEALAALIGLQQKGLIEFEARVGAPPVNPIAQNNGPAPLVS